MIIIRDWHGRYGLNARFYKVGNRFFLDYQGCRVTTEVYIQNNNGVVSVRCQIPDVPQKYVKDIMRTMQRQVAVPVQSATQKKPVTKKRSGKKSVGKTV